MSRAVHNATARLRRRKGRWGRNFSRPGFPDHSAEATEGDRNRSKAIEGVGGSMPGIAGGKSADRTARFRIPMTNPITNSVQKIDMKPRQARVLIDIWPNHPVNSS
ncbi:hypothetical protein H7K38_22485 [Mycobacterium alsense]|uniref:Uncharacterized protein n=1 Tax=Mycobacterium alsense TaxID=324058 RepID=A0AA42C1C5_9MYCO|nr:hypothetical protein [Mycobacterium alsense]MCV7381402.1 hypothetical protein [Mycobacterium alsense]